MNLKPRRSEEPDVNLTSLIDVVLILIIFFMVSTTFNTEGRLRVQLPQAATAPRTSDAEPIVVTITAEGRYRVNERELVDGERETLEKALAAAGDRSTPVTIRADGRATHQAVVTAMDAIARAGFAKVALATEEATR